jgi:hypothetical protein
MDEAANALAGTSEETFLGVRGKIGDRLSRALLKCVGYAQIARGNVESAMQGVQELLRVPNGEVPVDLRSARASVRVSARRRSTGSTRGAAPTEGRVCGGAAARLEQGSGSVHAGQGLLTLPNAGHRWYRAAP